MEIYEAPSCVQGLLLSPGVPLSSDDFEHVCLHDPLRSICSPVVFALDTLAAATGVTTTHHAFRPLSGSSLEVGLVLGEWDGRLLQVDLQPRIWMIQRQSGGF